MTTLPVKGARGDRGRILTWILTGPWSVDLYLIQSKMQIWDSLAWSRFDFYRYLFKTERRMCLECLYVGWFIEVKSLLPSSNHRRNRISDRSKTMQSNPVYHSRIKLSGVCEYHGRTSLPVWCCMSEYCCLCCFRICNATILPTLPPILWLLCVLVSGTLCELVICFH
jgi:hypothetical protein